jgi:formate hydrogenlyase subunit 6/NADH:ubiquinone oxidoreductase subunit I
MENNLAYIDFEKCKLCRKCVEVCPTEAIHEINFPARKVKETEAASAGSDPARPVVVAAKKPKQKDQGESSQPSEN